MAIECEAYAGPLDGVRFITESPYASLYIRARVFDDDAGQLINWEYNFNPLPHSHRYYFHYIHQDSGIHVFKPFPPFHHAHT